ncbi:eCIS core domain-containing protein [Demequina mangrovi]|uniref:eCIS core domain-containing protein n=1 Tax=Demequina mangrovi TaxID=1043493 RepID=A0A1H6U2I9_9MICO|nr:DUF4157 domain-containing protein [Demequina mangrovi]SEI82630.1 protein of unknown function [Demequina mangrovi]
MPGDAVAVGQRAGVGARAAPQPVTPTTPRHVAATRTRSTLPRQLALGGSARVPLTHPASPREAEAHATASRVTSAPTGPTPDPAEARATRVGGAGDPTPADPGRPLPRPARAWAEPALGTPLDDVRIHTGPAASDAAARVGATAFTVGSHITFSAGAYSPDAPEGRRLLAHELTHVLQHRREPSSLVHRQPAVTVDTAELPEGTHFQVLADGTVLIDDAWLLGDPGKRRTPGGGLIAPTRMQEVLHALRAAHLPWVDPAEIPRLATLVGVIGADLALRSHRYELGFSLYQAVGPPPGVDAIATRAQDGMSVILRQSRVAPGAGDTPVSVNLSPEVRAQMMRALEDATGLGAHAAVRERVIHGSHPLIVRTQPGTHGIQVSLSKRAMEDLFGVTVWEAYLALPRSPSIGGTPTPRRSDAERYPRWLPRGTLAVWPVLERYVAGANVDLSLEWDHGVSPDAGFVLLPGHCDYEWRVTRDGKTVDSQGSGWFGNSRTARLELDGGPGVYRVAVVATSRHFLTPDHTFRAHLTLTAVDEATADRAAFDRAATGRDQPFERGPRGVLRLKPGQKPLTVAQELQSLAITEGAMDALLAQGRLTADHHRTLKEELAKQRAGLERVSTRTAGGAPYVVRGSFVSREDSTSTDLRVLLHFLARASADGWASYSVILHDTTLGAAVQHPGSAVMPVARDANAEFAGVEAAALDDMADHVHAHNDYPDGTVHLAAQMMNASRVWEAKRDTANARKTAKSILGTIALAGGVVLLFVPGGGFVSAAIFTITATAGVAAVALEIEDRVAKEGELKFDRRLALDVLQVVSVALPFGRLAGVLANASRMAKVGYLVSMTTVDVAQGFLIAAEVRDQLALIEASTELALARATTDDERRRILADRDRKVGQVIGGAMINGGFILLSVGGGLKETSLTLRDGTGIKVRNPIVQMSDPGEIRRTLERGWFEHPNTEGTIEKVAISTDERAFLAEGGDTPAVPGGDTPAVPGGDTPASEPAVSVQPPRQPVDHAARRAARVEAMRTRLAEYGRRPGRATQAKRLRKALDEAVARGDAELTDRVVKSLKDTLANERVATREQQHVVDLHDPRALDAFDEAISEPSLEGNPEWVAYRELVRDRYVTKGLVDVGRSSRSTDGKHVAGTAEMRARFLAGIKDAAVVRAAAEMTTSHLQQATARAGSGEGAVRAGDAIWVDRLSGDRCAPDAPNATLWPADPVWGVWRVDHIVELRHGGLDDAGNYVAAPQRMHAIKTDAMRAFGNAVIAIE